MTDNNKIENKTAENPDRETEFLKCFDQYLKLEIQVQQQAEEIKQLQEKFAVGPKLRSLYQKLRAISAVLNEEIPSKAAESLQALDSWGLYRILSDVTLFLADRILDGAGTEEHYLNDKEKSVHSDSELRAVHFLYLLIRYVESNRKFPTAKVQRKLFDGYTSCCKDISQIMANSLELSPLVRAAKAEQKKQGQRNSVGIGSDQEDAKFAKSESKSTQ